MAFSKTQGKKQETGTGSHLKQQRGNNNNTNNNNVKKWPANNPSQRNNNYNAHSNPSEAIVEDQASAKEMHDRMLFLLGNMIGAIVEATVKNGCKFRGIFHGASTEGDLAIALSLAQKIFDPLAPIDKDKTNPNPIINTLLIYSKDLVEITVASVDLTDAASERNTFKTDADITGKLEIKERELHKWAPTDEDNALGLLDGDLESSGETTWDQFAVNEKLFGLKTDFDEEIYTTPLNRSAPGFKDREKKAIQVANEIQKSAATNVHILEERGISIDDSGLDEEDLYGAVVRDGNKYIPPALRKQSQQSQEQNVQQAKKETRSNNKSINKIITSDLPKSTGSNPSPIASLPTTRRESNEKGQEKTKDNEPPKRIESEIASTFKHFAMMEKDKLNAKKQALQKKEKDGRLAELKMFHQTFKLNVPVPADLVPLLSKGKKSSPAMSTSSVGSVSPDEKKKKPELSTPPSATTPTPTQATTEPVKKSSPVQAKSPLPSQAASATSAADATTNANKANTPTPSQNTTNTGSTTGSTFKLNAKASSFKPNPSAAAFIPGGLTTSVQQDDPHSFFGNKHPKKNLGNDKITMKEAFKPPFLKKSVSANSIGPTWPFGSKSYRVQFSQFNMYDEDVFGSYPSPGYGYAYPQYRYPQYVSGVPQMAVQQGVPYMSPQFVSNVPISAPMPPNAVPPTAAYSPQMANVSPHGSPFPQGFPSPQRSPMVPQGMPPQVYQYQGAPMMMRYPPEMMMNNAGGPPMMMQRPVMMEPMQYSPHQQSEASANDSGAETPPTN
ncbi:hypothetical protein BCV72DRAFT_90539 [Rhizopus microsporus var. microsporus]|uniref:LsmAD domain-containing protein n=2 Tax=Rhizopus microsporus TaxID=58291 RepID=A0A2G4SVF1_RHIZD|nr:uncharacterized protein RHIMIDRAFT_136052 [Rhizopus microsporus ATCC 52813]ORE08394.1 hypothetical protein BCV72DRAFT_90539 [Rhizopus microsporus var. microsporus]PHZ12714.1 hypothetical protein RHIMIDRAFT_136052 [Rhizopus microsporus ATCC 52813]